MDRVPWQQAWQDALYAPAGGFYVTGGGPAAHFATAAHGATGAVLAAALLDAYGARPAIVVDVGAGRGELSEHLLREATGRWPDAVPRLVAVDVVDRPDGLPDGVAWVRSPGGPTLPAELADLEDALVVAHEWLDVVPCPVAEVDADGVLRTVLVDPAAGTEHLGEPLAGADLAWARSHWPAAEPGDRVEVGAPRDAAWADLVGRVRDGVVVGIDYGHVRADRPPAGSLAGYASGSLVPPVPDGSCDITAHVAVDTLAHDELLTQRQAVRALGVSGSLPDPGLARRDPAAYLAALTRANAAAQLAAGGGYGDFWWVIRRLGGRGRPLVGPA